MPITTRNSYLPTMDEFIEHWSAVSAALRARGEPELILRDGTSLPAFVQARRRLALLDELLRASAERQAALRWERDPLAQYLGERLREVRELALEPAPPAEYARWMRDLAPVEADGPRRLRALEPAVRVWQALNATVGERTLASGYRLRQLKEDARQLRELSRELRRARNARRAHERERWLFDWQIRDWMAQYRCVVRFDRRVDRELLLTLPRRHPGSYPPGGER